MFFPFMISPLSGHPVKTEHLDAILQHLPPSLFALVVDQAPVAITVTDLNADICYANQAFCELTGYPLEELEGRNQRLLSSKQTPVEHYQTLWETIRAGRSWQGRIVNRKRCGQDYLAELTISPILNAQGETSHYLAMQRDISDSYRLTQQLANQKAQAEAVLNATSNVMAVFDDSGEVLLDNLSYKTLRADFEQVEPIIKLGELLKVQHGLTLPQLVDDCEPVVVHFEVRGVERWLGLSTSILPENSEQAGDYFERHSRGLHLLLASDMTEGEKLKHQAHLELLQGQLNDRKMLAAVRETLLTAIYKLSQPVNLLQAAQRLGNPLEGSDSKALAEIVRSAEWALSSLQQECPKPVHEPSERVGVIALLGDAVDLLQGKSKRFGVELHLTNVSHLAWLHAQHLRILSCLELVIEHAIVSASKGHEHGHDEPMVRVMAELSEHEWVVHVEDNGPLLDAIGSHRILQPFYSRESLRDEFGIGLSMARDIVLDHQGSIDICASSLGGCKITISLPLEVSGTEQGGSNE
jgi:nitrogen fixation negative regulator NifL